MNTEKHPPARRPARALLATLSLLLLVLTGATQASQTFSDIEYAVSQPNGPDCPPTCSQVELTLDAQ